MPTNTNTNTNNDPIQYSISMYRANLYGVCEGLRTYPIVVPRVEIWMSEFKFPMFGKVR